jgi:hypothetical protein
MIKNNTFAKTVLIGLAVVAVYKTSRRQVIASGMTVASISKDLTKYVSKHYSDNYKKAK